MTTDYVLSNRWERERERLDALTAGYDAGSLAFCRGAGLDQGSRVLEVGPGTGRFAQLLAEAVGPTGSVIAVDIDPSLAESLPGRAFHVVEGDARDPDSLPAGPFDLVFARLVIGHLADRTAAIAGLTGLLQPGGWLVVEDFDRITSLTSHPAAEAYSRGAEAIWSVLATGSFDGTFGRGLVDALSHLEQVEATGVVDLLRGDPAVGMPRWELLLAQLEEPVRLLIGDEGVAQFRAALRDPAHTVFSPVLVRARGRYGSARRALVQAEHPQPSSKASRR